MMVALPRMSTKSGDLMRSATPKESKLNFAPGPAIYLPNPVSLPCACFRPFEKAAASMPNETRSDPI